MSTKVVPFVQARSSRARGLDRRKLDAAYRALAAKLTDVMAAHMEGDAGVLAMVKLTGDVIAEVRARGRVRDAEMMLAAICQRGRRIIR